jgi:hypothetical protein
VSCPKNEEVLEFQIEISEKYHITGELKDRIGEIQQSPTHSMQEQFEGFIVNTGSQKVLVSEKDKDRFFPELQGLQIKERIFVNYVGTMTLAHLLAEKIFGKTHKTIEEGNEVLVIKQDVRMIITEPGRKALVEFVSTKKNDIIADQFCYLLSNIFLDPFSQDPEAALTTAPLSDYAHKKELMTRIILEEFPESKVSERLLVVCRGNENLATVNLDERRVDCPDEYMKMRLYGIMDQYIGCGEPEPIEEE